MSAVMLHQAAEHALNIPLEITMGLWIYTNNLDKLIRYCSMVSYSAAGDILEKPRERWGKLIILDTLKIYMQNKWIYILGGLIIIASVAIILVFKVMPTEPDETEPFKCENNKKYSGTKILLRPSLW